MTRADWILRPILWFATAFTITLLLHGSAPMLGLAVGVLCLLAYRPLSSSVAGLPLLYLSTGGIATFFGHLASMQIAGALASAAILFWQGRELQAWIPRPSGRVFGVIAIAVLPLVVGTAIVILINQPTPGGWSFVFARAIEASFGVFTVLGAATGQRRSAGGRSFRLWWLDGTLALLAILAVRIAARGIPIAP